MHPVLVIENIPGTVEDIYTCLADNFPDCECYPVDGPENPKAMRSLLNKAIAWSEENKKEEKEKLALDLADFINKIILQGKTPEFAIIDVGLKDNPEGEDLIGAELRRDILTTLFPGLQVLYSTVHPEHVLLASSGNSFNVNGKDRVLGKVELGGHNSFKDILVEDFEAYSGLPRADARGTILTDDKQKVVQKKSTTLGLRNANNSVSKSLLFFCSILKIFSIVATFLIYLACLGVLLWKFLTTIIGNGKDTISQTLQIIEKLFIIPLPLIIITGISIFFDQVIATRFSPDHSKFDTVEGNSKYYINLSKSLFISTLISVLAIKLIEMSFSNDEIDSWQEFAVLALCTLVLFVFYFIIARSLHSFLKSKGH